MTLIERIETLTERAEKLGELDARRAESSRLQDLRDKVKPINCDLGQVVQRIRLLQDAGIPPELDQAKAGNAQKPLHALLRLFEATPKAESLIGGKNKNWNRFEEAVKTTTHDTSKALKDAWLRYIDNAYSGERPDDLKGSLPQTERNLEQLKVYRRTFDDLRKLRSNLPDQRADFDRVRDLIKQLSEITHSFERDVPEAVDHFLRAVNAGGADLDLLTTEVMDWLRVQNKTGRFRVIAGGSSS